MKLNYKEYGSGSKVLIVLHGFLGSLDNWHSLSNEWAKKGLHIFTVDARNHGNSDHTAQHSIPLMVDDLKLLMEQINLEKAILLGHSMGGKTAMQFALTHGNRTDKLIVADMAPRAYPRGHDAIFSALENTDLSGIHSRKQADSEMEQYLPDYGVRQFILKNLERSGDTFRWKFNLDTLKKDYENVLVEISSDQRFNGKVLFIKGERSTYILDSDLPGIRRLFPDFVLNIIPDAGHWIHVDQPVLFSEAVLNFVNS